jgi:hypothetical protein
MMKFYTFLTVVAMAFAASATSIAAPSEEPTAPDNDYKLVVIDQNGLEHFFDLQEDNAGCYTVTLTLDYDPYYQFEWDPNLDEYQNQVAHQVPFYFLVNGRRYAPEDTVATTMGYSKFNPLIADGEGFYTVPVGLENITIGLDIEDDAYYVFAAVVMPCGESYKLVVIDYKGIEHIFNLQKDNAGNYITQLTLDYDPYYEFEWDYTKTEKENKETHPVPFYFYVNGVRYGAETTTPATFDIPNGNPPTSYENPLTANAEGNYTLPIGYSYDLGLTIIDGKYCVYALNLVCPYCYSVDEMSNSKMVQGVCYYNMAGQEVKEPNGMTIVVTTYTDGSTSTAKVIK